MNGSNTELQATLSSKCQLVIPRAVRQAACLRPGDVIRFFVLDGVIQLVPVRPITEIRGSLPQLTADNLREEEDRL